jgi:hypothetical protein
MLRRPTVDNLFLLPPVEHLGWAYESSRVLC